VPLKIKSLSPKSPTHESLKEHAEAIAHALNLTAEQGGILSHEIRNAITPLAMLSPEDDYEEVLRDVQIAVRRIIALCDVFNPPLTAGQSPARRPSGGQGG
jgi:hypothetical protein